MAKDFHEKYDGEVKNTFYIFGGYTSAAWESKSTDLINKYDPTAFIFSLANKDNKPFQSRIKANHHKNAIYCCSLEGPSFGNSDIIVKNNFYSDFSYSNFGNSYIHPQDRFQDRSLLAGSCHFQLSEIEVFKKE